MKCDMCGQEDGGALHSELVDCVENLKSKLEESERERLEQSRLLDMSASRELAVKSRLDSSQKALGVIYQMAKGLPADLDANDWLREIQEVCGQVWPAGVDVERQPPKDPFEFPHFHRFVTLGGERTGKCECGAQMVPPECMHRFIQTGRRIHCSFCGFEPPSE